MPHHIGSILNHDNSQTPQNFKLQKYAWTYTICTTNNIWTTHTNEFGPATEYTRLLVIPPGHFITVLQGSCDLKAARLCDTMSSYSQIPDTTDFPMSGLSRQNCLVVKTVMI